MFRPKTIANTTLNLIELYMLTRRFQQSPQRDDLRLRSPTGLSLHDRSMHEASSSELMAVHFCRCGTCSCRRACHSNGSTEKKKKLLYRIRIISFMILGPRNLSTVVYAGLNWIPPKHCCHCLIVVA